MSGPRLSVIVRSRDSGATIARTLRALREQTVEPEIIVVDSGSRDDTLAIANRMADRVVTIEAERFSYGRALNLGVAHCSAEIHGALSSHCVPSGPDWVQRSLRHYDRVEVAATNGLLRLADGTAAPGILLQGAAEARRHVRWGFSNHGATWRADVWERFPFSETLPACEDREWALRVQHAGWLIAFDPALWVANSHREGRGYADYFRRRRREMNGYAQFTSAHRYGPRNAVRDWWTSDPGDQRAGWRRRISLMRIAGLAGDVAGAADGRRLKRGSPT